MRTDSAKAQVRQWILRTISAALGLGLAAAPILPAVPVRAESPTTQVFKSWTLACAEPAQQQGDGSKPKQLCRIYHRVHAQEDQAKIVFIATAVYQASDHKPKMLLTLPPVANLQRGITFQVDQSQVYRANIQICTHQSCISQFALSDDLLKLFRGGSLASFSFAINPQGEVRREVPLAGFASALDALQKAGS